VLATSSRAGSPDRPHPLEVRAAAQGVVDQMINRRTDALALVFGPEGDGLSNEDVARCDTLVTIPSPSPYRVLNLAQACLVACWEVNMAFIDQASRPVIEEEAPHDRLVAQWIDLAERSGFIHPGDPHKLRPRLERLFEGLSRESEDVRTLHGLVAQIKRNLKDRDNLLLKRPPRGTSRP
jgi:tRNA C32,U32 (ribose-2'-O)-methylase TrmJ